MRHTKINCGNVSYYFIYLSKVIMPATNTLLINTNLLQIEEWIKWKLTSYLFKTKRAYFLARLDGSGATEYCFLHVHFVKIKKKLPLTTLYTIVSKPVQLCRFGEMSKQCLSVFYTLYIHKLCSRNWCVIFAWQSARSKSKQAANIPGTVAIYS